MHKINNRMVPTYISELNSSLVSAPSEIIIIFLHHSLEQMFQQAHVYHQLSECGTTLMKVLKPNQQHHLSSIIYKPLLFQKYKYLATSHLEKDICLYCMLE